MKDLNTVCTFTDQAEIFLDVAKDIRLILENALSDRRPSLSDIEQLFLTTGKEKKAVLQVADWLREKVHGDNVSFVINRNINFTNVCYMGCKFCGFAKRLDEAGAEWISVEQVVKRAEEAWNRGASEVCIQGGLHPKLPGTYYRDLLIALKKALPELHIHAFSPFEIWYGARKMKLSYSDFLEDLKECGLNSMPGTAAEILDKQIREKLTKNKLSTARWVEIIKTAHSLGIPSTATIMYGHIDGPMHWAIHLDTIRRIQIETGGFTEFVPLSFVHYDSPLFLENPNLVRPGASDNEIDLMHAVSRIALNGLIDNVQVSWTKLGAERARNLLSMGVNDMGGTLMNESISRSAGSKNGQEITEREMVHIIRSASKVPVRRNTLYKTIKTYGTNESVTSSKPLVSRDGQNPLSFLD
ncbi:5-amino-6-(D-ribitylamino)uracil--L-tyrosine 4-hydroxyphenyl transferase CofH [Paracoccaceae bacterium]|nr:5-amino-6-(D-ribitylamino)uracil--L-tyrosine 4-hydroxyphenyl transferase CofH [Paracoccaceae bacterium]